MRKDVLRTKRNKIVKNKVKNLLKAARKDATANNLSKVTSALDKAAKHNLIHPNKAARLKSRLAKLASTA